jgi:lysyl-tRNA synthetase class 2
MSDDWRPSAPLAHLQERARILEQIRAFFMRREVLEVETPYLSSAALTHPHIESFACSAGDGVSRYLHTSPEFPMKRLLAAGSGPIYQICRVFRQGESGCRHNPEFTLLEWYRPGFTLQELMAEVADLVRPLLGERCPQPSRFLTYRMAFLEYLDIDPLEATTEELAARAAAEGIDASHLEMGRRDGWLELLLTARIEPQLGQRELTFLYDYPASQAALARINPDDDRVAERFELYFAGVELANGFRELCDGEEQRGRFEAENRQRQGVGLAPMPLDERLLAALEAGMPDSSGVALGVDRLVMLALGESCLEAVLAFPCARA